MFELKSYLGERKLKVEKALSELMLPETGDFINHVRAMRYSLFAGGKRIRPVLCLAAAELVSDDYPKLEQDLLPVACALECIHTYSLIHDDLPAMDDDILRRGLPTNHVKFGEAEALLAGDGLLTFAFDLLSQSASLLADGARLQIIQIVARAAGPLGMVGGQSLDMAFVDKDISLEQLRVIHKNKTGALITASLLAGGVAAEASEVELSALKEFGDLIGLAFQVSDDLLDVVSTTEELGKTAGSDVEQKKSTYPVLLGIDKTKELITETVDKAVSVLSSFSGNTEPLRQIAIYIGQRTN